MLASSPIEAGKIDQKRPGPRARPFCLRLRVFGFRQHSSEAPLLTHGRRDQIPAFCGMRRRPERDYSGLPRTAGKLVTRMTGPGSCDVTVVYRDPHRPPHAQTDSGVFVDETHRGIDRTCARTAEPGCICDRRDLIPYAIDDRDEWSRAQSHPGVGNQRPEAELIESVPKLVVVCCAHEKSLVAGPMGRDEACPTGQRGLRTRGSDDGADHERERLTHVDLGRVRALRCPRFRVAARPTSARRG